MTAVRAAACGCTGFAVGALTGNESSHDFHRAIGFTPTGRVIFFARS